MKHTALFCFAIAIGLVLYIGLNKRPERHLLEIGYNTHVNDSTGEIGRFRGYTIDAVYLEGTDTVEVKGLSQYQFDSLQIEE